MPGYYFQIKNNLLLDGHRQRMGSAVWEFMWLLDRMTSISEEQVGTVLGGRPIKTEEIVSSLGINRKYVNLHLRRLEQQGYVKILRTPHGLVISLNKAFKVFGQKVKDNSLYDVEDESEENDVIETSHHKAGNAKTSHHEISQKHLITSPKNISSNIIQYTKDNTIASSHDAPEKTKENNIKRSSPALDSLKTQLDMKKLGGMAVPLNERGRQQVKLTPTQNNIIKLLAKYPELREIRAEFKKTMELESEDGYELANTKAWIKLWEIKVKKDRKALTEIFNLVKSHKFWSNRVTSGAVLLTNLEAIKKGEATFTAAKKEEEEPIGITENEFLQGMFETSARLNGTTIEEEKQKYEEELKEYKKLKAEGKM